MRKMFSASGSARKAARKSAAARRKNVHREVAPDPAAMQNETDYVARWAFLHATTAVMNPTPIDRLLDLLPMFSRWVAHFEIDENSIVAAMLKFAAANNCRISPQDDSAEPAVLMRAIAAWMKEHRFRDEWIAESALCTLFVHAEGRPVNRTWYCREPWTELRPEADVPPLSWKGNESAAQYLKRFDGEYRKRRKEFVKLIQFRTGERKLKLKQVSKHAKWTALKFAGYDYREIADQESVSGGRSVEESNIRKCVEDFRKRAGLTFPETRSQGSVSKQNG
jgi:hypothetical protein